MEQNQPSLLRRLLELFLAVLVILLGTYSLFAVTAQTILFQPQTYQQALADRDFYTQFPALLAEQLTLSGSEAPAGNSSSDNTMRYLGPSDLRTILAQLFPPDWVHTQTDASLNQLFAYLNLQTPHLSMPISLAETKSHLSGPQGGQIAGQVVANWPACSLEQLLHMGSQLLNGGLQGVPVCRPPQAMLDVLNPLVQAITSGVSTRLPDEVDLAQTPGFSSMVALTGGLDGPSPAYRAFRWSLRLSPIAALLGLLLLVFIAARNVREMLLWLGGVAIGIGLLALFVILVLRPMTAGMINTLDNGVLAGLSVGLVQFWVDLVRGVIDRYFYWVIVEAVAFLLLGLIAVGGYFLHHRLTLSEPQPQ